MLFQITNKSRQIRTLNDANGRSMVLKPGKSFSNVEFQPNMAEQLRRFQSHGSPLIISALDDEAREVLDRAEKPARRKKPNNLLPRPREDGLSMLREPMPDRNFQDELKGQEQPQASLGYDPDETRVTRNVTVQESPDQTEDEVAGDDDETDTSPPAQPTQPRRGRR